MNHINCSTSESKDNELTFQQLSVLIHDSQQCSIVLGNLCRDAHFQAVRVATLSPRPENVFQQLFGVSNGFTGYEHVNHRAR